MVLICAVQVVVFHGSSLFPKVFVLSAQAESAQALSALATLSIYIA